MRISRPAASTTSTCCDRAIARTVARLPTPQVDGPDVGHLVAVHDIQTLVEGDGGVDVAGQHPDPVAHGHRVVGPGAERDVLVGHEPAVAGVDHGGVAVVHA